MPLSLAYIDVDVCIQVKFPSRETVFDYWLDPDTGSFEQWTKSPYFFSIDYDSRVTPMTQVKYQNQLLALWTTAIINRIIPL